MGFRQRALSIAGRYLVPDGKSELLVRFAASVIWRVGASSVREASDLALEPEEEGLLRAVSFTDAPCADRPRLNLLAFESARLSKSLSRMIMPPFRGNVGPAPAFVFAVGGVAFLLRTSGQRLDPYFETHVVNGAQHVWLEPRPFDRSPEAAGVRVILDNMKLPRTGGRT